jgi:hypothetical protein
VHSYPILLLTKDIVNRIARNVAHFETWSTHQGCEQVSYSDLPDELMADVTQVFDTTGRLPKSWVDKVCFSCLVCTNAKCRTSSNCRSLTVTRFCLESLPQRSCVSFLILISHLPAYSPTQLITVLLPSYIPRSALCIPLGVACSACESRKKNGRKRIMSRMCECYVIRFIFCSKIVFAQVQSI